MSSLRVFSVFAILAGAFGAVSLRTERVRDNPQTSADVVRSQSPVEGYKSWTKVNSKPYPVSSAVAFLCSAVPKLIVREATNPHIDQSPNAAPARTRFVTVYINDAAKDAMLNQKTPVFPVGSIIVKEKLVHADGLSPELLTVMRKRETGFNPAAGDWEYIVVSGDGSRITAQGKLKNCESCHADYSQSDYVARTYLSDKWLRVHN